MLHAKSISFLRHHNLRPANPITMNSFKDLPATFLFLCIFVWCSFLIFISSHLLLNWRSTPHNFGHVIVPSFKIETQIIFSPMLHNILPSNFSSILILHSNCVKCKEIYHSIISELYRIFPAACCIVVISIRLHASSLQSMSCQCSQPNLKDRCVHACACAVQNKTLHMFMIVYD